MFHARISKVIAARHLTRVAKNMEGKVTTGTLVVLSDETPLKEAFNKAIHKTRLILLVSPT
jgi:hypothetical protein